MMNEHLSIDEKSAKQAAQAIKDRLASLGTPITLGHAYEAVAAAAGHPTWAVASAKMAKSNPDPRKSSVKQKTADGFPIYISILNRIGAQSSPKNVRLRILTETMLGTGTGGMNIGEVRRKLSLAHIMGLLDHPEADERTKERVRTYLTSLPGFQEEKGKKQGQTTLDAHNELAMLIVEASLEP